MHNHSASALQKGLHNYGRNFGAFLLQKTRKLIHAVDVARRSYLADGTAIAVGRMHTLNGEKQVTERFGETDFRRSRTLPQPCRRDRRAPARRYVFFSGCPRFCQYCSAIFNATSTAVDPLSEKKMCSSPCGSTLRRCAQSSSTGSCVNPASKTWSIFSVCAAMADMMAGWQCPCMFTHHEEIASIRRRPSAV